MLDSPLLIQIYILLLKSLVIKINVIRTPASSTDKIKVVHLNPYMQEQCQEYLSSSPEFFRPAKNMNYFPRTSNTGTVAIRTNFSATLPSKKRLIPRRPCVPMMIKSTEALLASSASLSLTF